MDYCQHQASVPAHTALLHVRWCQWCRAWALHARSLTQSDDGRMEVHYTRDVAMGPFDGALEVVQLGGDLWRQAVTCPGVPWDPRQPAHP